MTTVHYVKHARRDYPNQGIKRGDSYFWWKFNRGPKLRSKTRPKLSQLTQSPFWSSLYSIQEQYTGKFSGDDSADEVSGAIEDLKNELEGLRDETQEKLDNLPGSLSESPTAELLRGRVEALEELISTIDSTDIDSDPSDGWETITSELGALSCE